MMIEVSHGEIVDKLTILSIKLDRITDSTKLNNIKKEYEYLLNIVINDLGVSIDSDEYQELLSLNKKIWDSEDMVRVATNDVDYLNQSKISHENNQKRYKIKQKINNIYKSNFVEEKNYE